MKKANILMLILLTSLILLNCEKRNNTLEIGISDVLHKTFFRHQNCNKDFYYNILVKNDSIFVDGKLNNSSGNYSGRLTDLELNKLIEITSKINRNERVEREIYN